MDANCWAARLSSTSRSYKSVLQSRSGMEWDSYDAEMMMGFEEVDINDDMREEYPCSFCSEYFDIMGLCCHIDEEHSGESNNGVCPVCAMRVDVDMVAHIMSLHRNVFKIQRKRKTRKSGSHSSRSLFNFLLPRQARKSGSPSLLKNELCEGSFRSLIRGSSCTVSSRNSAPDPLLSSFILPMVEDYENVPTQSVLDVKKSTISSFSERKGQEQPMSIKDQEEKEKRSEFVRELLLSTILDDNLQ